MLHFRAVALLPAIMLIGLACGGCTVRYVVDEPATFDIAGPVAVDVQSFGGNVDITADEKLDHAEVTVTRAADLGNIREQESVESLDRITWTAAVESGPEGPVLTVRTATEHPEPYFHYAHVDIRLPAVDGLTVHTTRGRVYAKNVQGPIDVTTTKGDVRVMSNWPLLQPVTVRNQNGAIDYRVRGDSTGAFTCSTDGGHVLADAQYGKWTVHRHQDHTMLASLNDGSNPIDLETTNGNIRIAVIHNPTEVGIYIIEP